MSSEEMRSTLAGSAAASAQQDAQRPAIKMTSRRARLHCIAEILSGSARASCRNTGANWARASAALQQQPRILHILPSAKTNAASTRNCEVGNQEVHNCEVRNCEVINGVVSRHQGFNQEARASP